MLFLAVSSPPKLAKKMTYFKERELRRSLKGKYGAIVRPHRPTTISIFYSLKALKTLVGNLLSAEKGRGGGMEWGLGTVLLQHTS